MAAAATPHAAAKAEATRGRVDPPVPRRPSNAVLEAREANDRNRLAFEGERRWTEQFDEAGPRVTR